MPLLGASNTSGIASSTAFPPNIDLSRLKTIDGGPFEIAWFPEAASCDFSYGEPVILSTESVANLATAPAALAVSSSVAENQKILGWALAPATGTTGNRIAVALANDNTVALGFVYAAAATNAQEQDVAVYDTCELFRYLPATGADFVTFVSASANATAGINSAYIYEKFGGPQGTQPATSEYAAVWYGIRPSLMQKAV